MDSFSPFKPSNTTFAMAVTPTAPAAATPVGVPQFFPPANAAAGSNFVQGGDATYRFYNGGSADAFIAYGPTSGAAIAGASLPVLSGFSNVLTVKAGETRGFTLPQGMFCAGIGLGSSTVYATMGEGIV